MVFLVQPPSCSLVPHPMKAFHRVLKWMYPVCLVHNIDFHDLVKEHEICHVESLVDNLVSLLTDLPCNVPRVQQDDSSHYDRLSTYFLADVVKFGKAVMKPGSHGHLFCSPLQLGPWFKTLAKEAGTDSGESIGEKGSSKSKGKVRSHPAFDVEPMPIPYT